MTDPLPIQPLRGQLDHSVQLPGSKSITNRALILAALSDGHCTLEGALFSRDTRIMLEALQVLGFQCSAEAGAQRIQISGHGGSIPAKKAELHVGNAGDPGVEPGKMLAALPPSLSEVAFAPWGLGRSQSAGAFVRVQPEPLRPWAVIRETRGWRHGVTADDTDTDTTTL